ncbi:MAG: hypothetical protein M1830_002381 [Pleopsidium flavum]|nr:MAG: hypothetical protein M1830_002381 [Pleopsidium flavum]
MPPKAAPRRQPARRNPKAPPPATEPAVTTTPNAYDNLPESSTDVEHAGSAADSAAPGFVEPRPQTNPSATSASSRPPVQRLQSLNRRTPSDTFSASTTSGAPSAKPTMKFKPKSVIRRSKEERDAQERLEAERRQARLAAAGVSTQDSSRGGAAGRGALRGLRGRGTGRWQNFGDRYGEGAMSGPFGAGVVAREEAVKRKATRGGVRSSTTTSESRPRASSRVKNEPGAKADRDPEGDVVIGGSSTSGGTKVKTEEQGTMDISSDDEEHQNEGPRMNIEQINLVSDEESDAEPATNKGKGRAMEARSSGWVLKPIRIDRKEHIERAVGVNTEASSLTSAELRKRAKARGDQGESLFLPMDEDEEVVEKPKKKGKEKTRDVEFVRDERKWRGVYQDEKEEEEDAKIKKEPTEDEDAIAVDFAAAPVRANDTNEPGQSPTAAVPESLEPSVKPKAKRRRKLTFRETKPVLQTEEDRQEWARHEEDIRLLDEELRLMDTGPTPMPPPTKDSEGDTSMEDGVSTKMAEQKEGRIYLIQLPPLVPKLVDQIKTESSPLPEELPPRPLSRPPVAAHKPKTPAAPPSAKITATAKKPSHPTIKPDPDLPPKQPTTTTALTASHLSLRTGRVGTLKLKQSGRVVLAWGGASLELGRGADSEFLQDVVLANSRRYKHGDAAERMDEGFIGEEARGGVGGEGLEESGWGLGQVMGKFVVLPDWRRLFGG